jgi:predicted XRE-type DNA-binding protein
MTHPTQYKAEQAAGYRNMFLDATLLVDATKQKLRDLRITMFVMISQIQSRGCSQNEIGRRLQISQARMSSMLREGHRMSDRVLLKRYPQILEVWNDVCGLEKGGDQ